MNPRQPQYLPLQNDYQEHALACRDELDLLTSKMARHEIISDFRIVGANDINACMAYATRLAQVKSIHKVVLGVKFQIKPALD